MLTKLDGERVPDSIAATVPNIPRSGVESRLFGSPFSFKRSALSQDVLGSTGEGYLFRLTTGVDLALGHMNAHVGYVPK